jgi:hypothetical protein
MGSLEAFIYSILQQIESRRARDSKGCICFRGPRQYEQPRQHDRAQVTNARRTVESEPMHPRRSRINILVKKLQCLRLLDEAHVLDVGQVLELRPDLAAWGAQELEDLRGGA